LTLLDLKREMLNEQASMLTFPAQKEVFVKLSRVEEAIIPHHDVTLKIPAQVAHMAICMQLKS